MKRPNFIIPCVFLAASVLFNPIEAHAETYSGVIEDIKASSSETSFVFTFSERQLYDITIIDPKGAVYNVENESSEIRIPVEQTYKGDYSFTIDADDSDFTYSIKVIDSGKTVATVGESKPTITENVSGLDLFFENGDLVATWSYSGKVSITITDPARFKNLVSNEQTSATEYRYTIPQNVDQIQFYICPVADLRVDGAGLTYTRDVVRNIDAVVNFPDTPIVNVESIVIPLEINQNGVTVELYNDNYTVGVTNHKDKSLKPLFSETADAGSYEVEIPLVSVENNLVACIIDKQGNAVTYSYKYIRDMQAPKIETSKLSLDNTGNFENYQTTNNTVLITGTITDEITTDKLGNVASLFINGYPVDIDKNGRFSFEEQLNLGDNTITIIATDESGNETSFDFVVKMIEEEKSLFPFVILALFTVAFIVGAFVIIKVKKTSSAENGKEKTSKESFSAKRQIAKIKKEQAEEKLKREEKKKENSTAQLLQSSMFDELFDNSKPEISDEDDYEDDDPSEETEAPAPVKIVVPIVEDEEDNNDMEDEEPAPKDEPKIVNVSQNKIGFAKAKNAAMVPILSKIDEEEKLESLSFKGRMKLKKEEKQILKDKKKEERQRKIDEENNVIVETYNDDMEDDPIVFSYDAETDETLVESSTHQFKAVAETAGINRKPTLSVNVVRESYEEEEKPLAEKKEPIKFSKPTNTVEKTKKEAKQKKVVETKVIDKKLEAFKQKKLISGFLTAIVLLGILVIFLTKCVENSMVVSASMEPTLEVGQIVVYNSLAYQKEAPKRGDIVAFWCEERNESYSKRVIGIAGDEISFKDGYVFINGMRVDESSYLDGEVETECGKTFKVPEGCVFVLGDNRTNSFDSRFFENPYIPISDIEGKYLGALPKLW